MDNFINKIINGDCLKIMKEIPGNFIDTIITDPPYGLHFIGKKWDYDVPSVELWKEVLRVLKPGGTALIFAGSRTQHRMAINIEDAGFILKDCIMWIFGSGFPKAIDISKQLDKKTGKEPKVVGKRMTGANLYNKSKSGEFADGKHGGMQEIDITEPATSEAKIWSGFKSQGLKPAYEPILVVMKPNEGTYANNALKWGVSGLNIDGGRIGQREKNQIQGEYRGSNVEIVAQRKLGKIYPKELGRFPANIILDEEAAKMLDEQSGETKQGHWAKTKITGYGKTKEYFGVGRKDTIKGGVSRFFYVAKASKAERNMGCKGLEEKKQWNNGRVGTGISDRESIVNCNNHPTVKPLKLMEYFCKLTKTPTGGIVLDPFMGSGTTIMACIKTGRKYIGIEKEAEYYEIAKRRIEAINEVEGNNSFLLKILNDEDEKRNG